MFLKRMVLTRGCRAKIFCLGFFVLLFIAGCTGGYGDGSGNFFDDPPDCYNDYLFGCGTFDIPGNSSYYGYNRINRRVKISSGRAGSSVPDFSGEWTGSLNKKSSSCSFDMPLKVQGTFSVKQLNKRVTVRLPITALKSYPLRGPASKKGFEASTVGFYSFCSFRISSRMDSANRRNGSLAVKAKINCPMQNSCEVDYLGSVRK